MARTKDQSFVNRYLNQYQRNQQAAVSAGQQAASSAANSGVSTMTQAAQNTKIPSLYDYAPDLMEMVVDQQKAQIKAQQAAAKAAQKEAEKAKKEAQKEAEEKYKAQKKAAEETMTPTAPAQKTSRYPKTESPLSYKDSVSQYTSAAKTAQEYAQQREALEKENEELTKAIFWSTSKDKQADIERQREIREELEAIKPLENRANEKVALYMSQAKSKIKDLPDSERIAIYLDPSYKLSKDEEKDAKKLIEQLRKSVKDTIAWGSGATDEERQAAFDLQTQADNLESKISNLDAFFANAYMAFPGIEPAADYMLSTGDEYNPETDSVAARMQPQRTQNPIASTAGSVAGTLASYAVGGKAAKSIPVLNTGLQKAGQALGGTSVAQKLSKMPILGAAFTPAAITDILGDQLVDTLLDTGVGVAANAVQGDKSAAQIAGDAAANFGTNLAFNIGSAGALGTIGDIAAKRRAARQAANAAQDAPLPTLDDAARQAAENAQTAPSASAGNAVPNVATYADTTIVDSAPPTLPENLLVEKWRSGTLTNADIETLKPGGENRAAFEAEAGVQLPSTSSETRRFLKQEVPSLNNTQAEQAVLPMAEEQALSDNLPPQSIGAMRHDPTSYSSMQNTYGTIAPGENPARVVDVPVSTNGTDRVGAGIRTIMEAPQTSDELVQLFEDGVRDGIFSHTVASDKKAFDKAVSYVENAGYKDALANWNGMIEKGQRLGKNDIIQGQLLYSLAAQNGDMETAKRLATDLVQIATESGQNLQAQRMLKRMTPEGRLYYAQTTVERLNKQLKDRFGDKFKDIVLDNALLENLKNANTEQAQREAMDAIYQNVADQMPATWAGRWNAWRYLSMLFNPATHVRNVVSNAINVPARQLKNIIGAGIERVALKEGDRTKAILLPWDAADQSLVQFAKSDIENVMDELTGAQKYSDKSAIMQLVDPFKINGTWGTAADSSAVAAGARKAADAVTSGLSKLYKTNSWALGAEDMLFKKSAYVDSLAQYLKANNIDPATATVKQLDKARKYAVEEALRATYTEYNSLATTLSQLERKYKAASIGFGGLIPFKSTPMNIIRRGVRYSPVGLAESLTKGFIDLRKGNINANQLIDNISQGLSGTSIFALGMFMGGMGWINGIGSDNAKESAWQNSQGWQTYSINLPGGGTYTIDWGGPSVMALLAGAETMKALQEEGADFNDVATALGNITEPMFDTTMLSGINSAIQSAVYSEANPITAATMQAVTNYVTQGVPSVFGAVARAADPLRRTTYSDAGGALGGIEKTMQRTGNKLPAISSENQPYIDVWGREQENPGGSFAGRLAYNLLSPGYYSPDRSTPADDLVGDLYAETGESGVLPGLYPSSIKVDGEKIRLSPEDYTLAKQTKGQTSLDILQTLSGYEQYNSLTPAEQQKIVEDVYSTASDLAKLQVVPSLMDEFEEDSQSGDLSKSEWFMYLYQNEGADAVVPYLVADEIIANVYGDKNSKGNTIPGSSRKNKLAALVAKGFTSAEAEEILDRID